MDANRDAFALYERAEDALPVVPDYHRSLNDRLLAGALDSAANRFGYALL
jgi:hypothetical protein